MQTSKTVTAEWLTGMMRTGETTRIGYATGISGSVVIAEAVAIMKSRSDGEGIVITPARELVDQWKRLGVASITRMQAAQELRRSGTILGHDPGKLAVVVLDEASYGPQSQLNDLKEKLAGCTILESRRDMSTSFSQWGGESVVPHTLAVLGCS